MAEDPSIRFAPGNFILDTCADGDTSSLGGLKNFIKTKKDRASELCSIYKENLENAKIDLNQRCDKETASFLESYEILEKDLEHVWTEFMALREKSTSDNASRILEVWGKLETICTTRFELLQSFYRHIEASHSQFSKTVDQALSDLTLSISSLELVDRPLIIDFAQSELSGSWSIHLKGMSKASLFVRNTNEKFEMELEDYAKVFMRTLISWKDHRLEDILDSYINNIKTSNEAITGERVSIKENVQQKHKDLYSRLEIEFRKCLEDESFPISPESVSKFQDLCAGIFIEYERINNNIHSEYQKIMEFVNLDYERHRNICQSELKAIGVSNPDMIEKMTKYVMNTNSIVNSLKSERDDLENDSLTRFTSLHNLISSVIATTLSASYFQGNLKSDMDTFLVQSNKAIEELKLKHGSNMQELEGILKLIMCKMDTEVDYEILEASFEEADRILKEMHEFTQNYQKAAFGYVEMIPGQNTLLVNTFRDKLSLFIATSTKKPIKDDIVKEENSADLIKSEPSSRSQSAGSKKKTVSIMPEGAEDEEIITSRHTGTVFYLLERGNELDWLFQRSSEWNKFKETKQEGKKNRKYNTLWYNTKRSKDKNRSAAYSVLVSGPIASASLEKDFFEKGNEIFERLSSQTNARSVISSANSAAPVDSDLLECAKKLVFIIRRQAAESFEKWSKSVREELSLRVNDIKKEIVDDVSSQVQTRLSKAASIEGEIYDRRSEELMTYRRAFENLDRVVRKKLESLNEERETVIHDLDSMCKSFYEQIVEREQEVERLANIKEFQKMQNLCEKSQNDFKDAISEALDKQLRRIISKIKALDFHFKDNGLQLRMTTSYDPAFKPKKAPLYQNLIDTLRVVTRDCEKKFIEDFKHWQENAITETKSWLDKFYNKLNKKQGYLELLQSIEKSFKQSKMFKRALFLKCETIKRDLSDSFADIIKSLETINADSTTELNEKLMEPLRVSANKLIMLGFMVGNRELIVLERLPDFEDWNRESAEFNKLTQGGTKNAASKSDSSISTTFSHYLKKLESDLMKQISTYIEMKKTVELGNIPKYQRSLYDSQYDNHAAPIKAKVKSSVEEQRVRFEQDLSDFKEKMESINETFFSAIKPVSSLLFEKFSLLQLSSSTSGFLSVFASLKNSEEQTQDMRSNHRQMLKVGLGHPNSAKELEWLTKSERGRSQGFMDFFIKCQNDMKDLVQKCTSRVESRGLYYLYLLLKISSMIEGKTLDLQTVDSSELLRQYSPELRLGDKWKVVIDQQYRSCINGHEVLVSLFLESMMMVAKQIQEFEKLLQKKIDVCKKGEERWQIFWDSAIRRISSIHQ